MESANFELGDFVRLTSGGPTMTIIGNGPDEGSWFCQWHEADGVVTAQPFPAEKLVKLEPPAPPK
ncbi:MAG TPA: DUF2158 domain-containing protein [Gemmataceae bacterium]|nr:DUF2158 domain-containing protein [Gemmataceae bacterium]